MKTLKAADKAARVEAERVANKVACRLTEHIWKFGTSGWKSDATNLWFNCYRCGEPVSSTRVDYQIEKAD